MVEVEEEEEGPPVAEIQFHSFEECVLLHSLWFRDQLRTVEGNHRVS